MAMGFLEARLIFTPHCQYLVGGNRTIRGITSIKHAHLGDRGDGIREALNAQDHLVLPRDALGGVAEDLSSSLSLAWRP
jgi:hypothetical protein